MRVDIVYPRLPPAFDAIAQHNVYLAQALAARGLDVGLIHAWDAPLDVPDVELLRLDGSMPSAIKQIPQIASRRRPNWLIAQYNPYSYGRNGLNPFLAGALRRSVRTSGVRCAVFVHEAFVPGRNAKLAMLRVAQRRQFAAAARASDLVLTSTQVWAEQFSRLWRGLDVRHLGMGATIPDAKEDRRAARARLRMSDGDVGVAIFGGISEHRNAHILQEALSGLQRRDVLLIYVGPSQDAFQSMVDVTGVRAVNLGRIDGTAVAESLLAADIGIAAFEDGVSERRTSFLAMIKSGLATVTNAGPATGRSLTEAATSGAFVLSDCDGAEFARQVVRLVEDPDRRRMMGLRGKHYYDSRHDWSVVAKDYVDLLGSAA